MSVAGVSARGKTGVVAVEDASLPYLTEGRGIPAIVIGSSIYYPRIFSQELRNHLQLMFLDHRAFVPSAGPASVLSCALDQLADDVERARQQLGLGRVVVIGHSGHAYMALEYAKRYAQYVSHVVMIAIAPDLGPTTTAAGEEYWQDVADPERKGLLAQIMRELGDRATLRADETFIQAYILNAPKIWFDPRFDSSPLWDGVELNVPIFSHVWGTVFRDIDITQGLEKLDRPVFLALGRYDFLAGPPSVWDPIRPKFHDLTVRVFERSGHTPQFEQPELFDRELLSWLLSKSER